MANNNRNSSPIIHECFGLIEKLCTSTIGIYVQLVLSIIWMICYLNVLIILLLLGPIRDYFNNWKARSDLTGSLSAFLYPYHSDVNINNKASGEFKYLKFPFLSLFFIY